MSIAEYKGISRPAVASVAVSDLPTWLLVLGWVQLVLGAGGLVAAVMFPDLPRDLRWVYGSVAAGVLLASPVWFALALGLELLQEILRAVKRDE